MTLLRRNFASDFARDVGSRSGIVAGHVWAAVLNPDGATYSINLTVGGVTTVKWSKIYWPGPPNGAQTDATFGDTINVFSVDGSIAVADTLQFLNSLQ